MRGKELRRAKQWARTRPQVPLYAETWLRRAATIPSRNRSQRGKTPGGVIPGERFELAAPVVREDGAKVADLECEGVEVLPQPLVSDQG